MKSKLMAVALAAVVGSASQASAAVSYVTVTDTVTGAAGDWTLDFTVTNNLPNSVLFDFGVALPATGFSALPSGWTNTGGVQYSSTGGPQGYFIFAYGGYMASGSSESGFKVTVNSTKAPFNVEWIAFADGPFRSNYSGGGIYWNDGYGDYGLYGGASPVASAAPEPSTWAMMLLGFGGLGFAGWRRKDHTSLVAA